MKLYKLIEKLNIIENHAIDDLDILSVCYDSRKACRDSLFVAVRGFETDGHKYIAAAASLGASAVICEEKPDVDIPYIIVPDSRLALALIGCAFYGYPSEKMHIIGVTGTSGKTTTTHLIKQAIESITGKMVGMIGTNGNYIGYEEIHTEHTTPESLDLQSLFNDMYAAGCEYVVMEVSSHALALDRVAGVRFDAAAFTNISQDHLDFHKDMDDYARAKKKIFSMCDIACINLDDPYSQLMLENITCDLITTSEDNEDADIFASEISIDSSGVKFNSIYNGNIVPVKLNIPASFSVYNALTVLSVGIALGFKIEDIALSLSEAKGVSGRMESLPTDGNYAIIRDYSHKPDPLEKVLKTLKPITKGKLVALFGCGGDRDRLKRPIMGKIAAENSDFVIVTSDNPRTEDPLDIINEILPGVIGADTPYAVIPDRVEAIRFAVDNAEDGDVILLAGKGHEDYQIIGHDKFPMDERLIVADIMKERNA